MSDPLQESISSSASSRVSDASVLSTNSLDVYVAPRFLKSSMAGSKRVMDEAMYRELKRVKHQVRRIISASTS